MSNVVKKNAAGGLGCAPVFNLGDVEAQARSIIASARARGAGIVDAAARECEALRAKAVEEGRRAGIAEGRKEGLRLGAEEAREDAYAKAHDEIAALTSALVKAFEEFSSTKEGLFLQAQKDLLSLSILIAKKIVAREVAADGHVTFDNVSRSLEILSARRNVVVRVAPQAVETVQARLPELAKRLGDVSSVKVEGDSSIAPGGCLINGHRGLLDATVDTQFAEVERILFGEENV